MGEISLPVSPLPIVVKVGLFRWRTWIDDPHRGYRTCFIVRADESP